MSWYNPISWVRKEVGSPGPGPKTEPFERRESAKKAHTAHNNARNAQIDNAADILAALYGDKVVALGLLSDYEAELEDLKALEALDAQQIARKAELEDTPAAEANPAVPGLISKERSRLYGIEARIQSQERIARRRYPRNFDFL